MKHELQENGHPAPEACYEVADILDKALEKHPSMKLDMLEDAVQSRSHLCGTVHCHAGAYLIGSIKIEERKRYTFVRGADLMAHNLGFKDRDCLKDWAYSNPKIWGNNYGWKMFSLKTAFNDAENVSEIAAWWRSVGDRIKEDNQ